MNQLLAVAVSFVLAGSVVADEVTFETVMKQPTGGPRKAAETVIRSEKEWAAFIETCQSAQVRWILERVKVDFEKDMLVGIALGPTYVRLGKGEMKVAGVHKVTGGEHVLVEYYDVLTDMETKEEQFQVYVIRMPKTKDVTFKKSQKVLGG